MKGNLSKKTTESALSPYKRKATLPSWNVLSRSQEIRGWTAWSDDGKVIAFQWTLEPMAKLGDATTPLCYRLVENVLRA
jgi:hypothetical protein